MALGLSKVQALSKAQAYFAQWMPRAQPKQELATIALDKEYPKDGGSRMRRSWIIRLPESVQHYALLTGDGLPLTSAIRVASARKPSGWTGVSSMPGLASIASNVRWSGSCRKHVSQRAVQSTSGSLHENWPVSRQRSGKRATQSMPSALSGVRDCRSGQYWRQRRSEKIIARI